MVPRKSETFELVTMGQSGPTAVGTCWSIATLGDAIG